MFEMKNPLVLIVLLNIVFVSCNLGNSEKTEPEAENPKIKVDSVYNWLVHMQNENGLLLSSEGGQNVSLYDNALSALVFTSYGDFEKAEKIFDFFESRLETEMLVSPGGFGQMRRINGIPVDNRPRRWMGDNAWLLIALNNYHDRTGTNRYHKLADALAQWITSLQDEDGGIWGGFHANGDQISKIAEGNIDAFNAISGYTSFHKKLLNHLEEVRWDQANQIFIAWADNSKHEYALDLHSWGYCIFEDFPKKVLQDADRFLTSKKSTLTNEMITGYCFDEDRDVVWIEGIGQMAVAFQTANSEAEAEKYLAEMRKNLAPSTLFENTYAFPYSANFGTSYGSSNLWKGADTSLCVSSTAWYLFAMLRFDPLELGRNKKIPSDDRFWTD